MSRNCRLACDCGYYAPLQRHQRFPCHKGVQLRWKHAPQELRDISFSFLAEFPGCTSGIADMQALRTRAAARGSVWGSFVKRPSPAAIPPCASLGLTPRAHEPVTRIGKSCGDRWNGPRFARTETRAATVGGTEDWVLSSADDSFEDADDDSFPQFNIACAPSRSNALFQKSNKRFDILACIVGCMIYTSGCSTPANECLSSLRCIDGEANIDVEVLDALTARVTVSEAEDRPGLLRVSKAPSGGLSAQQQSFVMGLLPHIVHPTCIPQPRTTTLVIPKAACCIAIRASQKQTRPDCNALLQDIANAVDKLDLVIANASITTTQDGIQNTFLVKVKKGAIAAPPRPRDYDLLHNPHPPHTNVRGLSLTHYQPCRQRGRSDGSGLLLRRGWLGVRDGSGKGDDGRAWNVAALGMFPSGQSPSCYQP